MHLIRHFQAQELQQQQQQVLQQQQQQQRTQHPSEHPDGRGQQGMNFLNVMPNPAIKTEPRDTSPLPYGMYSNAYRMPDQTPSPQPVSPSNPYNHNTSGTPSPYNMGAAGNGNLISPSHPYGMAGGGGGTVNGSPLDYDGYHQQHQQHAGTMNPYNHMQSPPSHTNQQWPAAADIKQPMPNINNLSNFNVNNILTKAAAASAVAASDLSNNNQPWNLPAGAMANNNYNMNHLMANTQHNQHHHHQQQQHHNHNDAGGQGGAGVAGATATTANEAPTLSSLLNMDSEQLMHFNSEELSNLSIS